MTKIVVLGPNLPDQSKGSFHIHAAGCNAIHGKQYIGTDPFDKRNAMDFDSESDVAHFVFADFESEMTESEMLGDIHFHSCVNFNKGLTTPDLNAGITNWITIPGEDSKKMHIISVEVFTKDAWASLAIETDDIDHTISVLAAMPFTRNIKVEK